MPKYLFGLIAAALAGVFMAVQGTFNSVLGKKIGLWETNLIVHLLGAVILLILLFVFKIGDGKWQEYKEVPWFTYLGGGLSILIIYSVAASIPALGVTLATTSIVTAQLITAALIDQFGLFGVQPIPFNYLKGIGFVLLIVGARLILNK